MGFAPSRAPQWSSSVVLLCCFVVGRFVVVVGGPPAPFVVGTCVLLNCCVVRRAVVCLSPSLAPCCYGRMVTSPSHGLLHWWRLQQLYGALVAAFCNKLIRFAKWRKVLQLDQALIPPSDLAIQDCVPVLARIYVATLADGGNSGLCSCSGPLCLSVNVKISANCQVAWQLRTAFMSWPALPLTAKVTSLPTRCA